MIAYVSKHFLNRLFNMNAPKPQKSNVKAPEPQKPSVKAPEN